MRHPFFWGAVIGAAAYYVVEHFGGIPKMNAGKYAHS